MWGEVEGSPVFTPGSNDYCGLIASTTNANSGSEVPSFQGLSDEDANDLCKRYLPLAFKTAGKYRDRGIDLDELRSAGLTGLVLASRRYDPRLSSFGTYAKFAIKGQITELFKKKKSRKEVLCEEPISEKVADAVVDLPPIDLKDLNPNERRVIVRRAEGETLKKIGKELGFSAERARQIETRATEKLRRSKGKVALACIRDLVNRRGYRRPSHQLLPFRPVTYSCRSYTPEEIAALVAQRPDLEGSR